MAYSTNEVLQALIQLIRNNVSGCFVGTVSSTDKAESDGIVEVEINELTYEVRLQAVTSASAVGIMLIPKQGSSIFCVAEGNSDNSFVAVSFSEVEKVTLTIEGTTIAVDNNTIVFNNGNLGGLVLVDEVVGRLNNIEKAFNDLLNNYKLHNHTHPQGATTGLLAPYTAGAISETNVNDIENDKILQ